MKGKYKRQKVWCHNCDAEIVEVGNKCLNCGRREVAVKIKKHKMNRELAKKKAMSRDCYCVKGKDRDNNYNSIIDEIFDWHESEVKKNPNIFKIKSNTDKNQLSETIIENNEFIGSFNKFMIQVFEDIKDINFESENIHLHKGFMFWEMVEKIAKTHLELNNN